MKYLIKFKDGEEKIINLDNVKLKDDLVLGELKSLEEYEEVDGQINLDDDYQEMINEGRIPF